MSGSIVSILISQEFSRPFMKKLGLALLVAGVMTRMLAMRTPIAYDYKIYDLYFSSASLVFGGVVTLATTLSRFALLNRLLSARVLVFFGKYSYGIYLIHHPILHELALNSSLLQSHASVAAWLILATVGLGITLPLCWLIFHGFEAPFLRLKDRTNQARAERPLWVSAFDGLRRNETTIEIFPPSD